MLNRYNSSFQTWHIVTHPLIDGQGGLNAYVNYVAIDDNGGCLYFGMETVMEGYSAG